MCLKACNTFQNARDTKTTLLTTNPRRLTEDSSQLESLQHIPECKRYQNDTDDNKSTTVDGRKFATATPCLACAAHAANNENATVDSKPLAPEYNVGTRSLQSALRNLRVSQDPPAVTTFLHSTLNFGARGVHMSMWMCLLCMCGCCELSSVNSPVITRQRLPLDASLLAPTAPSNLEVNALWTVPVHVRKRTFLLSAIDLRV